MALGVNPIDLSQFSDARQIQAGLLQNLGRQLSSSVQAIQTQRQLSGLAQNIQQVDPNSENFSQQMVGLMSQYPMAAQSPIGQAAINTLGAQHRAYQAELAAQRSADRIFDRQVGLLAVDDYRKNRTYGAPPMSAGDIRTIAGGGSIEPTMPTVDPAQAVQPDREFIGPVQPSPVDQLGAKLSQFRQGLVQQGVPQELGERMMADYQRNLMAAERPQQARLFPTADGRLVAATPTGATEVPMPDGMKLPTRAGSDPLLQTKARLTADYVKAKAVADREQAAWAAKNVNEKDPKDVAEKWEMGIKATAAKAAADSIRSSLEELGGGGVSGEPSLTGGEVRGAGKPMPPEIRDQAIQAMSKKGKNAVIQRLLEAGYDTTGL